MIEDDETGPSETAATDRLGAHWDAGTASGPAAAGTTMAEIKAEARRRRDHDAAAPGLR